MSAWQFKIYSPTALSTVKATLDPTQSLGTPGQTVTEPKFRHPFKGIGSGSFMLQLDDAALADITEGDLVRCFIGSTAVFEWIVQTMVRHTVAKAAGPGVPSGEKFVEVAGPSTKAYGARSPIQPWRGGRAQPKETVRAFDWTSPHFEASGFDLSDWESAAAFARVDQPSAHWEGTPEAYPDNMIYWVGAGSVGDDDDATEGVQLIRWPPFTLTEDKLVGFFSWCDNEGILYLNGNPILSMDGFHACRYIDLQLVAGDYYPATFLRNETPTATSSTNNPAGTGLGIYERTAGGLFVERIYVSNVDAEVLALPTDTPGMPIGYSIRKLIDEAQGRSELVGVTPGFTNTADTLGSTFPQTDPGAVVGQSFTDFILGLEDAIVDVDMAPGLVLNVYYPKGSNATASTATFTDGVSLFKLDHEIRDDRITKLFIDYDGGYLEVGTGEFSKPLKLSQVASEDAVTRIADEILTGRDVPSVSFKADIVTGTGREPYVDFVPGDTVHIDDVDGSDAQRTVQAITFSIDRAARPKWGIEVGDLLEPLATIADRAVKRFVATRSATNIHSGELVIKGSGGQEYKWISEPFTYEPSDLQISQKTPAPASRDIAFLEVQLDDVDAEDHTFKVNVNGSHLATMDVTIAAGDDYGRTWADIAEWSVIGGSDKITLEFTGGPVRFSSRLVFR